MEKVVIALGGNALLEKGEKGFQKQLENMKKTAKIIGGIVEEGYKVAITHGNGRQVGDILLRSFIAKEKVPPLPLDAAGAESQGQIGYLIQNTLRNELGRREEAMNQNVVTILTQVLVDPNDPAFECPTKFIGPYYSKKEARELEDTQGWEMKEDPRGGWRRVVPSPDPKEIIESEVITNLLQNGNVVISGGGGGIPVIQTNDGYKGVKAVIDKDLVSELLAEELSADKLVILTDIEKVMLNFGTSNQKPIEEMTVKEAEKYMEAGHFKSGSMKPKVKAGIRFARSGPDRACVIAHLKHGKQAVEENAGTLIKSKERSEEEKR